VKFAAPVPLDGTHATAAFRCGEHSILDAWLAQAPIHARGRTARTFVVCEAGTRRVVGYYALNTGSVRRSSVPSAKLRRGLPDPTPVVTISRLAVDLSAQGRGLGSSMLADARDRILRATREIAAWAILVDAIDDAAVLFYRKHGFMASVDDPRTLILPLGIDIG
jgi:ribosomal protein S18 acetylase RimI-like enzyme